MKNILGFLLSFFIVVGGAVAQNTTTITGVIQPSGDVVWSNAFWTATLVNPSGGNPVYTNGTPAPRSFSGNLSSVGAFASASVGNNANILPTGTSWRFTFYPTASAPSQSPNTMIVSGASLAVGTPLSAGMTALQISASNATGGPHALVYAYALSELINPVNGAGAITTGVSQGQYFYNGAWTALSGGGGSGSITPQSVNNLPVYVGNFAGATPALQYAAALASVTGVTTPVKFVFNTTGNLGGNITIPNGDDADFPFSIAGNGFAVTLAGKNHITCMGGATLTSTANAGFFGTTADYIMIDGCNEVGDGSAGAELLQTTNSNHVKITRVNTNGGNVVAFSGGTDLQVSDVTVLNSTYGVVVSGNAKGIAVTNIDCFTVGNCFEVFNADVDPNHNPSAPVSRADVLTYGGDIKVDNIKCNVGASCAYSSAAYNMIVSNGSCKAITDVCWDAEGSIDVVFTATNCESANNGCGARFFYGDNEVWENSRWSSSTGSILFTIKNASLSATNATGIRVSNNQMTCYTVLCTAIQGDPTAGLVFDNNNLTNAMVFPGYAGYTWSPTFSNNHLNFTIAGASAFSALRVPNLGCAGCTGTPASQQSRAYVLNNDITTYVSQPANSNAIENTSNYGNASVNLNITSNITVGFTNDLNTTNAGNNAGLTMSYAINANTFSNASIVHTHVTADVDDYAISYYTWKQSGINGYVTRFANSIEQNTPGAPGISPVAYTGALLVGGTASSNFPYVYHIAPGSTLPTSWSTNGTYYGINAASGFAGNFLDFRVNGSGQPVAVLGPDGRWLISGATRTTAVIGFGSAPTMAPGAAAGTSPTCTTITGNNLAGVINCTTGTATTTGTLLTVTQTLVSTVTAQGCSIQPRNALTALTATSTYTTAPTTNTWTIAVATALAISTAYSWSFNCF